MKPLYTLSLLLFLWPLSFEVFAGDCQDVSVYATYFDTTRNYISHNVGYKQQLIIQKGDTVFIRIIGGSCLQYSWVINGQDSTTFLNTYFTGAGTYQLKNNVFSIQFTHPPVDNDPSLPNNTGPFMVWPNPVHGTLFLDFRDLAVEQMEVYALSGRRMCTIENCATTNMLDVSNWPEGLYLVRFKEGDQKVVARFFKSSF